MALALAVRVLLCVALSDATGSVRSHGFLGPEADDDGHQERKARATESNNSPEPGSVRALPQQAILKGTPFISFTRKKAQVAEEEGPMTSFVPRPSYRYSVRADVRLLDDVRGQLGQDLFLMAVFGFHDGRQRLVKAALHPVVRKADGWITLHGDFRAPSTERALKQIRLRIQGPVQWVRYQVTNASIADVWQSAAWKEHTDRMIDQLRKSDIHFNVTADGNIDLSEVEIQVTQTRKSFPLGTAVNSWGYLSPRNQPYRDFIHDHFTWAVHESAMKWFNVEKYEGEYRYGLPLRVLHSLRSKGLKVRGHALMWSVDNMVPKWVRTLPTEDRVRSAVENHIHLTMNRTRGLVEQWDVNNENVHGQWYQRRLMDFDFEQTPYRTAHLHDPTPRLFLNDYSVVAHGSATGAFVTQARRLKAANVGLHGLGAQCHFYKEEMPDVFLVKERLDRLAETGLPVWITEFNIVAEQESKRARFVEMAMRAFYSHPAVQGILLWGFWDQHHSRGPHAALVSGSAEDFRLTAAGQKFLDLWENQWMTKERHSLRQSGPNFTVRGFHGDYRVRVHYRGNELSHLTKTLELGKSSLDVSIAVRASDAEA